MLTTEPTKTKLRNIRWSFMFGKILPQSAFVFYNYHILLTECIYYHVVLIFCCILPVTTDFHLYNNPIKNRIELR